MRRLKCDITYKQIDEYVLDPNIADISLGRMIITSVKTK